MHSRVLFAFSVVLTFVCLFRNTYATASEGAVQHLYGSEFYEKVVKSGDLYVVTLLDASCEETDLCKKVHEILGNAAAQGKGYVHFGYAYLTDAIGPTVDGDLNPVHQIFNVTAIPEILIYGFGTRNIETPFRIPATIAGQLLIGMGVSGIYTNLKNLVPNMVESVGYSSFPSFLKDVAPTTPRVLLFSDKTEVSMMYRKLAMDFSSYAIFCQGRQSDAKLYDFVKASQSEDNDDTTSAESDSNPTPRLFIGFNDISSSDGTGQKWKWIPYTGPLNSYDALHSLFSSQFHHSNVRNALMPQLRSSSDFDLYCKNSKVSVCIIGVAPGSSVYQPNSKTADNASESDRRDLRGLPALEAVVFQSRFQVDYESLNRYNGFRATRPPMSFSWIDSEFQADFLRDFDIASGGYGIIALNPHKKSFAAIRGTFDELTASQFVAGFLKDDIPPSTPEFIIEKLKAHKTSVTTSLRPISSLPNLLEQPAYVPEPPSKSEGVKKKKKKKKVAPQPKEEL